MLSHNVKFLSLAEEVYVKDTDFNISSYETKKNKKSAYEEGKVDYYERQGQFLVLKNKSNFRQKLLKLEESLKKWSLVYCHWLSISDLCLVFSSGLICYLNINVNTLEVSKIRLDKYCIGKIHGSVSSVIFTDTSLLFTFPESSTTIIYLNECKGSIIQKIASREPKIQTVELFGSVRKSEKILSSCSSVEGKTVILVWSVINSGEVFPWSPEVRGEDRADVHLYSLTRSSLNLIAFHHTEHDAVNVELSRQNANVFYSIEQKNNIKAGITVEGSTFEINDGNIKRCHTWSCTTLSPVHCVSRQENSVLMSCVDASVILRMENGALFTSRAPFIPSSLSWCDDILLAAEERGRIVCWDRALQTFNTRLDLATHLTNQPLLQSLVPNLKINNQSNHFLFLIFTHGPLAFLTISVDNILKRHLKIGNFESAVRLLKSHSWENEGDVTLQMLHSIVGELFRKPLNEVNEQWLQEAIGTFLAPLQNLSDGTLDMYEPHVRDIARKFFHHLVRYGRLDKAMSLAIDLEDYDLFVDIQNAARKVSCKELEEEAKTRAETCYEECEVSSSSCCSGCSRQESISESETSELIELKPSISTREPPPLPYLAKTEESYPIAVIPSEPIANCASIRPNIHQYIDRNTNLWKANEKKPERRFKPTHKVIDVIPKPSNNSHTQALYKRNVFQKELREDVNETLAGKTIDVKASYKPVYSQKSALVNRHKQIAIDRNNGFIKSTMMFDSKFSNRLGGEKNKVKFSDTVTIAVVPESLKPSCTTTLDPKRELADSLPLCHPHMYLKDFTPLSADTTYYV